MRRIHGIWIVLGLASAAAVAQVPGEVGGVRMDDPATLAWDAVAGATEYTVYEGPFSWLRHGYLLHCDGDNVAETAYEPRMDPGPGEGVFYLVTATNGSGTGTPGQDGAGHDRWLGGTCAGVQERAILGRAGFGGDEWSRDRIATLGIQGYVDEQLDPQTIDESTNTELHDRLVGIEPPQTVANMMAVDIVHAVYARRQLEQNLALFWSNHFNTEYLESYRFLNVYRDTPEIRRAEAISWHHAELEAFRARALDGNFREILEDSATSRAMIVYLDTDNNVAGAPNENFARELLELHTMGVDGEYTHHEINEMARVMTGWDVCKKDPPGYDNVHATCIDDALIGTPEEPEGRWESKFRRTEHDCGQKMLFHGTAHETVIADSCAFPIGGAADITLALDVIAAHPSTSWFISTKLLQHFVTDHPTDAMIQSVVDVWNDGTNPHGIGDLREVTRAVLDVAIAETADAIRRNGKIKDPFEHVVSGIRAVRGRTNGSTKVRSYLVRMKHRYHENPIPTGYAERGDAWIDTNGVLERQNYGMELGELTWSSFGSDIINLLQDHGISTSAGNEDAIVDFLIEILFGGVQTSEGRAAAIEYLTTDETGQPSGYDNAKIRQVTGFMLGYPEFLEQ